MIDISLYHRFADFTLDLAFSAPAGVTALFGRSGSGKTTVVNAVAGLLHPERGRIVIAERILTDTAARIHLAPHRRRIGYVFQDARLFPHLNVRQNLRYGRFFAAENRATAKDDLHQTIELLGITHLLERRPGALSGGEAQRVAIGRALLSRPALLLMDEPLAALDEARKAEILPYLERLRDQTRIPILYVSHSVAEVARLATTVVLLEAGRLQSAGSAAKVLSDPGLAGILGRRDIGAVLRATFEAHEADGLSRLRCAGGVVYLSGLRETPGAELRLRVPAQDVILAREIPRGISALNILSGTVLSITDHGPDALVNVLIGDQTLLSRVTRRSVGALALIPGCPIHAIVKSVMLADQA
jgi:molybdate transport system ATP-binding protein